MAEELVATPGAACEPPANCGARAVPGDVGAALAPVGRAAGMEGTGAPTELGAGANGEPVIGRPGDLLVRGDFWSRACADSSWERSKTVVFSSSSSQSSPVGPPPNG